jgi:hypothetical protein
LLLENKNSSLERIIEEQKQRIIDLENKNKELTDKLFNTFNTVTTKAIENAGNKIVNQSNNNIQNLYQNLKPITTDHLREQAKFLERQHIRNGPDSIAYFANEYSYKDRIVCTDVARRSFVFKDESGNIIKDPKGVQITRKFVENNKDELVKLLEEYSELYYEDVNRTWFTYEKKCKIDECLYAIKRGEKGSNMNYYNTFLKEFTSVLSRLTYNKKCERLEMPSASEIASEMTELVKASNYEEEVKDYSDEEGKGEGMTLEEMSVNMINPFENY